MFYLFAQSCDEAGDRMIFISLSASLPPRSMDADGSATMLSCSEETAVLVGSEDTIGSGNYCVIGRQTE